MKSTTEVTNEIRRIVQDKIDCGVVVRVEWLTTEIMAMKCEVEGDDADFYIACAVDFIKATISRVIGKYAPKTDTDNQLTMDGFDHLQKAYTVTRDNQITLVPVTMLTDDELEARALEYEAMAFGCVTHAQEIRTFIKSRLSESA